MQRFFTTFALGIAVLTPFLTEKISADSVNLPKAERPVRFTQAPDILQATETKQMNLFDAVSSKNYKSLEGKNVIGYMYSSYNNDFLKGFHRIKTNGYTEFLYIDQYNSAGYYPTAVWPKGDRLCMEVELTNLFSVLDSKYIEMDPLTGEVLLEKQVLLKDPVTEFANYLPSYINAVYSPTKDRIYGYTLTVEGGSQCFFSAPADDPNQSVEVCKAGYNDICVSLCYNEKEDAFYGINRDNTFVKVNYDGSQEYQFDINYGTYYELGGLTYLPEDNKYLYFLIAKDKNALCEIDPETQTVTELAEYYNDTKMTSLAYFDAANDPMPFLAPEITALDIDHSNRKANLKFTIPTERFDETPASGSFDWIVTLDGNVAAEGTANAGDNVEASLSNFEIGTHRLIVSNSQGNLKSASSSKSSYIGLDVPTDPKNLDFAEDTFILSWDPVSGKNNGYLDENLFKYVVRINGEIVGETKETSFKVNIDENLPYTGYQASVQADNGGVMSNEVTATNIVRAGKPWELDVYIAPDPQSGLASIPYDKDGDKRGWDYREDRGEFVVNVLSNHKDGGDDILYLPPMVFDDPNATYEISYDVICWTSAEDAKLGINISEDTDPDTELIPIVEPILIPLTDDFNTYSQKFSVAEAGVYNLSFESITKPYKDGVRIKNIYVKKLATSQEAPNAVENLEVTSFEKGELKAKAKFTMPTTYVNGQSIPEGTEIKVVAQSAGVTEITGTPGSEQELAVETIQGYNDVKITTFIGENEGQNLISRLYTGEDTAGLVTNMTGYVTEDNHAIVATWEAPESGENAGENGFYVNADNFEYVLMELTEYGWEEKENLGKNVFNYTLQVPEGSELATANLGISVRNIAGRSSYTSFLSDVLGKPYEMPMVETFENASMKYKPIRVLRPDETYIDSDWGVVDPSRIYPEMAVEGGVATYGRTEEGNAFGMLMLPKVSTVGSSNAGVIFHMWNGFDCADITILGEAFGMPSPMELKSVESSSNGGWSDIEIPFPAELQNQKWVAVYIDAYFEDPYKYVLFSSYTIKEGVSGVETVADGRISISSTPGNITVENADGERIAVYSIDGRVVANIGAAASVENISLNSGIYVVNVAGESVKIVVK